MGKVHPATGYIRAWINGEEVLHKNIRTDLEAVWDTYQAEVLRIVSGILRKRMEERLHRNSSRFSRNSVLDVTVSEPDFRDRLPGRFDFFSGCAA